MSRSATSPRKRPGRSSGGETRTLNHTINSRVLCRLSYPGIERRLAGLEVSAGNRRTCDVRKADAVQDRVRRGVCRRSLPDAQGPPASRPARRAQADRRHPAQSGSAERPQHAHRGPYGRQGARPRGPRHGQGRATCCADRSATSPRSGSSRCSRRRPRQRAKAARRA